MRVLLDTNVILDVLLNRAPWVTEAKDRNGGDEHCQDKI